MAKRKTRKQKILADQRHVLYHLETSPAQESHPIEKESKAHLQLVAPPSKVHVQTFSYSYVTKDIQKTALVTGAILTAQIVLFMFLNRM